MLCGNATFFDETFRHASARLQLEQADTRVREQRELQSLATGKAKTQGHMNCHMAAPPVPDLRPFSAKSVLIAESESGGGGGGGRTPTQQVEMRLQAEMQQALHVHLYEVAQYCAQLREYDELRFETNALTFWEKEPLPFDGQRRFRYRERSENQRPRPRPISARYPLLPSPRAPSSEISSRIPRGPFEELRQDLLDVERRRLTVLNKPLSPRHSPRMAATPCAPSGGAQTPRPSRARRTGGAHTLHSGYIARESTIAAQSPRDLAQRAAQTQLDMAPGMALGMAPGMAPPSLSSRPRTSNARPAAAPSIPRPRTALGWPRA